MEELLWLLNRQQRYILSSLDNVTRRCPGLPQWHYAVDDLEQAQAQSNQDGIHAMC